MLLGQRANVLVVSAMQGTALNARAGAFYSDLFAASAERAAESARLLFRRVPGLSPADARFSLIAGASISRAQNGAGATWTFLSSRSGGMLDEELAIRVGGAVMRLASDDRRWLRDSATSVSRRVLAESSCLRDDGPVTPNCPLAEFRSEWLTRTRVLTR